MTARQPKGTPIGGQFAEGRRPEGGDLQPQITPRQAELNRQAVAHAIAVNERGLFKDLIVTIDGAEHMGKFSIKSIAKNSVTLVHTDTQMQVSSSAEKISAWKAPSWTPARQHNRPTGRDSRSEEVQNGEVFDTVLVVDSYTINGEPHDSLTNYYRRRPGIFGGSPYSMRLQASRPLSDEEMSTMAGLVGYAYRAAVAGEPIGNPMRDSPFSFTVSADTTKSSRDDLGMALEDFEEALPTMIAEGSPIRKTNRAGAGTQGTRLVEGLGSDLKFELYYDDVWSATPEEDPRFADECFDRI